MTDILKREAPPDAIPILEELYYYDGPLLLSAGTPDAPWIGSLWQTVDDAPIYMAVPVTAEELDAITQSKISVRAAFLDRNIHFASLFGDNEFIVHNTVITVEESVLPKSGVGLAVGSSDLPDRISDLEQDSPSIS